MTLLLSATYSVVSPYERATPYGDKNPLASVVTVPGTHDGEGVVLKAVTGDGDGVGDDEADDERDGEALNVVVANEVLDGDAVFDVDGLELDEAQTTETKLTAFLSVSETKTLPVVPSTATPLGPLNPPARVETSPLATAMARRRLLFVSATYMVPAATATLNGPLKVAAEPAPSPLPLPTPPELPPPACVVTAPVETTMARMRLL